MKNVIFSAVRDSIGMLEIKFEDCCNRAEAGAELLVLAGKLQRALCRESATTGRETLVHVRLYVRLTHRMGLSVIINDIFKDPMRAFELEVALMCDGHLIEDVDGNNDAYILRMVNLFDLVEVLNTRQNVQATWRAIYESACAFKLDPAEEEVFYEGYFKELVLNKTRIEQNFEWEEYIDNIITLRNKIFEANNLGTHLSDETYQHLLKLNKDMAFLRRLIKEYEIENGGEELLHEWEF